VRITTIGAYTIHRLAGMFSYVDAMIVDTPIVTRAARSRIKNVDPIRDRLERAELFRQYLDAEWMPLDNKPHAFSWPQSSSNLRREIDRITRGLDYPRLGGREMGGATGAGGPP
jgi:hypothetical protein